MCFVSTTKHFEGVNDHLQDFERVVTREEEWTGSVYSLLVHRRFFVTRDLFHWGHGHGPTQGEGTVSRGEVVK